jgi:hypothetical protein
MYVLRRRPDIAKVWANILQALKFSQDQEGFQSHLFSIFQNAYGVVFFGTTHRGSEMASMGRMAAKIAGLGLAESDQELLRALEMGSTELQRISDAFSRMLPRHGKALNVYSFLEGLPITGLSVAGKVESLFLKIMISLLRISLRQGRRRTLVNHRRCV